MTRTDDTDAPTVWLMLAIVGDPITKTVTCSIQSEESDRAVFTVHGGWAADIAKATEEYLGLVSSIYANYVLFQGLNDDRIQE